MRLGLLVIGSLAIASLAPEAHAALPESNTETTPVAETPKPPEALAEQALQSGDFEQARGLYLKALAQRPSPQVVMGLGLSEFELRHFREAAENLEQALRTLPDSTAESQRKRVGAALLQAKTHVATLLVKTNREGANVRVDGKLIGKSPLAAPVFLEPGAHEISVQLESNSIARPLALNAGQELQVDLPLVVQTTAPSGAPSQVEQHQQANASSAGVARDGNAIGREPLVLAIGAALTATGVTSGIVFLLDSNSEYNKADTLRARIGATGCVGIRGQSDDCRALLAATKAGDRSRDLTILGFATAGVAVAGSLAYWYWPRHHTKTTALQLDVFPQLSANQSGLQINGTF